MNAKGHRLTAELLRIFLERELCKLARASERAAEEEDDDDQAQLPWLVLPAKGDFDVASRVRHPHQPDPPRRLSQRPTTDPPLRRPSATPCQLGITSQFNLSLAAIDKASIWHCLATGAGGHPLVPSAATGWCGPSSSLLLSGRAQADARRRPTRAEWTDPTNQKVFLRATKPGASFSFETSALADGTIVLGFLSSAFLPFGDLRCSLKRADDAAGEPLKVKDVVLRGAHKQDLPLPMCVPPPFISPSSRILLPLPSTPSFLLDHPDASLGSALVRALRAARSRTRSASSRTSARALTRSRARSSGRPSSPATLTSGARARPSPFGTCARSRRARTDDAKPPLPPTHAHPGFSAWRRASRTARLAARPRSQRPMLTRALSVSPTPPLLAHDRTPPLAPSPSFSSLSLPPLLFISPGPCRGSSVLVCLMPCCNGGACASCKAPHPSAWPGLPKQASTPARPPSTASHRCLCGCPPRRTP